MLEFLRAIFYIFLQYTAWFNNYGQWKELHFVVVDLFLFFVFFCFLNILYIPLVVGETGKTYTSFREESNGICRIRIGQLFVELSQGSIVNANTEVIVNSTNEGFDLGGKL